MIRNYDRSAKINDTQNSPYIPDHTSIIGGSGSCFTKLNEKMTRYWHKIYIKFIYLSKIHSNQSIDCLSMEEKEVEIKELKLQKHSKTTEYVYENLDYNPTKKRKVLIVLDDVIANMKVIRSN